MKLVLKRLSKSYFQDSFLYKDTRGKTWKFPMNEGVEVPDDLGYQILSKHSAIVEMETAKAETKPAKTKMAAVPKNKKV